eukprot:scaffold117782_cov34-Prasinocladus_malaysianus.AAC.1
MGEAAQVRNGLECKVSCSSSRASHPPTLCKSTHRKTPLTGAALLFQSEFVRTVSYVVDTEDSFVAASLVRPGNEALRGRVTAEYKQDRASRFRTWAEQQRGKVAREAKHEAERKERAKKVCPWGYTHYQHKHPNSHVQTLNAWQRALSLVELWRLLSGK